MVMQDSKTYTILALAGTIPFVACALLPLIGYSALPYVGSLDTVVASYGLAIVCFLAGTHWGIFLSGRSPGSLNLFIVSNVVFLAVWFAYIGGSLKQAIVIQLLAFVALLLIDRRLKASDVTTASYYRVRAVATAVAVVSLAFILTQ